MQLAALRGRDMSQSNADAIRSASSPQLTKTPRSKVYRKTSLKTPFLTNEADIDGSVLEKNGVIRYEKKQKRRSLAETDADVAAKSESKWERPHRENVHITCNPLSTPYPYSTPAAATTTTTTTTTTVTTTSKTAATTTVECDEEPKSRSCGSFLPILALIPHSVISFQYLSPKMKFSWWRNKIS